MTTFEVPKKCKAAVVVNEGPDFHLEVEEVDVPEPGPGQVLVKLNCTGLCGSDIHYMLNDLGFGKMSDLGVRSPGHEGAGIVVKLGEGVTDWKVGDRAGIKPIWDCCHNCEQCWTGSEQYCSKVTHTGIMCTGTYQEYVVSPALYTSRIPDGVPDEVAAPIMCSASTMHRALKDSGLKPGNWLVFPGGGGGVGLQGVQLARAMGMRTIVVDSGAAKKELALRLGAEDFIDFKEEQDIPGRIKKLADGIGAHGVLVTAWQSYKDAVSFCGDRVGAIIMCIGLPPADQNVIMGAPPAWLALKKMRIQGSIVGTMEDTATALEYARRGLLKPIQEVRGLSAWPESVQQLKRGEVAGRVVIDFSKA
ncbi:alcohol dehydrogenase [Pseudocercospora fuligena]|uniref:Alcohol dehydrogenase n=1 Tax=Pseudocercospora fuligena TaxID=685502 RepID=A0A8H6VQG9_9PEZI|nr:alcohol dehydrogenase [Pseudocercospora fuligena]